MRWLGAAPALVAAIFLGTAHADPPRQMSLQDQINMARTAPDFMRLADLYQNNPDNQSVNVIMLVDAAFRRNQEHAVRPLLIKLAKERNSGESVFRNLREALITQKLTLDALNAYLPTIKQIVTELPAAKNDGSDHRRLPAVLLLATQIQSQSLVEESLIGYMASKTSAQEKQALMSGVLEHIKPLAETVVRSDKQCVEFLDGKKSFSDFWKSQSNEAMRYLAVEFKADRWSADDQLELVEATLDNRYEQIYLFYSTIKNRAVFDNPQAYKKVVGNLGKLRETGVTGWLAIMRKNIKHFPRELVAGLLDFAESSKDPSIMSSVISLAFLVGPLDAKQGERVEKWLTASHPIHAKLESAPLVSDGVLRLLVGHTLNRTSQAPLREAIVAPAQGYGLHLGGLQLLASQNETYKKEFVPLLKETIRGETRDMSGYIHSREGPIEGISNGWMAAMILLEMPGSLDAADFEAMSKLNSHSHLCPTRVKVLFEKANHERKM